MLDLIDPGVSAASDSLAGNTEDTAFSPKVDHSMV
jgi:hypothetical protein